MWPQKTTLLLSLWLACMPSLAFCQGSSSAASTSSRATTTNVRIRVSVSEHLVTLSCDVTAPGAGSEDHKVQFYCPVLPSNLQCFGECSPICNMQSDGSCPVLDPILVSGVSCGRSIQSPDSKSVSLTVDTRLARLAGAWHCKFRGSVSATVDLAAYAIKTTPTALPSQLPPQLPTAKRGIAAKPSPTHTPAAGDLGVWKPDIRRFPADLTATQDDFERHPNLAKFARTDYIIGILAIMSASLLLNLGFCLRCILARHYVETRKRSRQKPLGWLGSCLCVSTVQVDLDVAEDDTDPSRRRRQLRQQGLGAGELSLSASQNQRLLHQQQQQQQQHCLYCMQTDCRILYDDVARTGSECGSNCFRGYSGSAGGAGGGGSSFRVPAVSGRGGSFSMSGVPEEGAGGKDAEVEVEIASSIDQQEDAESDISASAGGPGSRLALSRRMLRKADTLLREANSLLLETEPTTDDSPGQ